MKKLISFALVTAMLFCMLPLTALAEAVDYTDVDYSTKFEFGEIITTVESTDPYVEPSGSVYKGYGKGYNLSLTEGKLYNIYFSVYSESATDGRITFYLFNNLSDSYYDDEVILDTSTVYSSYSYCEYTIECQQTGTYYLLVLADVKNGSTNLFGEDLELGISVYEFDKYTATDFSQSLKVGEDTAVTFSGSDPMVTYEYDYYYNYGYANGVSVELEGDTYYRLSTFAGERNYFSGSFMLLNKNLTGSFSDDAFACDYIDSDENGYFYVKEAGTYNLFIAGYVYDFGNQLITDETDITVNVGEVTFSTVEIDSAEKLVMFGDDLYNESFEGDAVKAVIKADIDMSSTEWVSIDPEYYDIVVIEGNGKTVSGINDALFASVYYTIVGIYDLTVDINYNFDNDEENDDNLGVIGNDFERTLVLNNVHTTGSVTSNAYCIEDVGGIAGELGGIVYIDGCSSTVDLDLNADSYIGYIGGIHGYYWSNFGCSVIENTTWSGSIKAISKNYCVEFLGGFVGCDSDIVYKNCSAVGNINVSSLTYEGTDIGGFAGCTNNVIFDRCFVDVDLLTDNTTNVGGFIGYGDENTYKNCYSSGSVEGEYQIGGFVGLTYYGSIFLNCYTTSDVVGVNYIGGFAGTIVYYNSFVNCYATGTVESTMIDDENTEDNELDWLAIGSFFGYTDYFTFEYEEEEGIDTNLFDNCYAFKSDLGVGTVLDLDTDIYTTYNGEGIIEVDFSNDDEVAALEDALNKKVDELTDSGFEDLLGWGDRNEDNGPMFVEKEELPPYILGDVDNDGDVDADDYILLKRIYFGTAKLENLDTPETAFVRSDVNCDGGLDADDYITLKRYYFGTATLG